MLDCARRAHGRIRGTREFVIHENYRLVYEIDGQTIWLLALVHNARQWPPLHYTSKKQARHEVEGVVALLIALFLPMPSVPS